MENATIESVILQNVEIQLNGIVRNSKGRLIARLVEDVDFKGEHVKGISLCEKKEQEIRNNLAKLSK